jgi:hypothetical protein
VVEGTRLLIPLSQRMRGRTSDENPCPTGGFAIRSLPLNLWISPLFRPKNARNLPEIIHRDIHRISAAHFIARILASLLPVRRQARKPQTGISAIR